VGDHCSAAAYGAPANMCACFLNKVVFVVNPAAIGGCHPPVSLPPTEQRSWASHAACFELHRH
jgi:hypothetical protein